MVSGLNKNKVAAILQITEDLNQIRDIDSLLDRVLLEARRFSRADAGSIYLLENQKLRINYVQNDTLIRKESGKKFRHFHLYHFVFHKSLHLLSGDIRL